MCKEEGIKRRERERNEANGERGEVDDWMSKV